MTSEELRRAGVRVADAGIWRLSDFDLCECGDYRKDHIDGVGRYRMPDNLTHGFRACLSFRLARSATAIPAPYSSLEPIND